MKNTKYKVFAILILFSMLVNLISSCSFAYNKAFDNQSISNIEKIEEQQEKDIKKTNNSIKAILNIDTNLNNTTFNKNAIHIEGWKLATEENTQLQIYIDDKKIDNSYIKYSRKYDLISIVKNYGTYKENPKPNFDINIPIDNISQGTHKIKIELISQNQNILQKVEHSINIDKNIKSILNIDTNLNNTTFGRKGIHIEGWKLATEENTKLQIYIDNTKIDDNYIKYSYKYNLTSIVKGYGTSKENPKPNFDIDIPINNISQGKHKIKIELVMQDGTILQKSENIINIDKSIKSILNIDTNLNNTTFGRKGIHIEGWKLATEENTKLQIYIDNTKIDDNYIKYSYKYNLTSIVKGYGTSKENPKPNFDIDIPTEKISNGTHLITIKFISKDGSTLQSTKNIIKIDKTIKSILNIDTNLENYTFDKNGIHIEGWKLADIESTKLNVYMNNTKIDNKYIKYAYKYNLTSIVKGYGTSKENPTPNFDINIPTQNFNEGKYTIKIEFVTSDGTVLQKRENVIYIKKQYKGIDVSEFNGNINWNVVKQNGVEFAMIRLGYRGYRTPRIVLDNMAIRNIKSAQSVGIKVGVYFVTQAITVSEAQEEALWVIGTLDKNGIKVNYPVALDVEKTGVKVENGEEPGRADLLDINTRTLMCRAFADVIRYNGRTPMIYANTNWFENYLDIKQLTSYDIWLANYTEPKLSTEYDMWQYTNKGNVLGILGYVDLNICYKKY